MKTYKDYLIDFDKLKIGTKLWSSIRGNCRVIRTCNIRECPIEVAFDDDSTNTYTKDGKEFKSDEFASLFKEKPDFFKEKKEVKTYTWYCLAQNGHQFLEYDMPEHELPALIKKFEGFSNKLIKWEKIDCTEKTEVIYE